MRRRNALIPLIIILLPTTCGAAPGIYYTDRGLPSGGFYFGGKMIRTDLDGSNSQMLPIPDTVMTMAIDELNDRMYYLSTNNLSTADIWQSDLNGRNRVRLLQSVNRYWGGIDLDPQGNRLFLGGGRPLYLDLNGPSFVLREYWTAGFGVPDVEFQPTLGRIYLSNSTFSGGGDGVWSILDADKSTTKVVAGLQDISGIAVDSIAGHLYYAAWHRGSNVPVINRIIYRSDLDGSNEQVLIDLAPSGGSAVDLEVVPELNAIFWTDEGSNGGVWRADLNGNNRRRVIAAPGALNLKIIVPEPTSVPAIAIAAVACLLTTRNSRRRPF